MTKFAFLFPGQGAQFVGMGMDFHDACAEARDLYRRADDVLGFSLSKICFEGPAERLEASDVCQPAILVTSLAMLASARAAGIFSGGEAQAAAGLSLGEYTALCAAGSLEFESAVRLTSMRGKFMQDAAEATPSSMVSIIGLDEDAVANVCAAAAGEGTIVAANFNSPGQIVVSGTMAACKKVREIAADMGARDAIELNVAGAYHSPVMTPARRLLEVELEKTHFAEPKIKILANVTGNYYTSVDEIRPMLARQVDSPVRWQQSMERLLDDGFDEFYEIGPGRVLTGLLKRTSRKHKSGKVKIHTLGTVEALSGA